MKKDEKGNKEYNSLKDYLRKNDIDGDSTAEEIEEGKKKYRQYYQRLWEQENRQKRIRIAPSKEEYQQLKQRAEIEKMPLSQYVLKVALAGSEQAFFKPKVEGLEQLIYELNAIGRNINTVVKEMHSLKSYNDVYLYEAMREDFRAVDKLILDYLNNVQNPSNDHQES